MGRRLSACPPIVASRVPAVWPVIGCALLASSVGCSRCEPPVSRVAETEPVFEEADTRALAESSAPPSAPDALAQDAASAAPTPLSDVRECLEGGVFDPKEDASLLEVMRTAEVERITRGSGGATLGFKVTLAGGKRAYFKPDQAPERGHVYGEIAAFHLDRLLGLCRTSPVTGRRLPFALLRGAAPEHPQLKLLRVEAGGLVQGALIAWIEGELRPLGVTPEWLACLRTNTAPARSPFKGFDVRPNTPCSPPPGDLLRALHDLIVFDYLIANVDRWSPARTNLLALSDAGLLLLFDHGEAFWQTHFVVRNEQQLDFVGAPRPAFAARLSELDLERVGARLADDPLAPVLDAHLMEGLRLRLEALRARGATPTADKGNEYSPSI